MHCCILQKLGTACTQVRRLWISMDISMDIHRKSVDMDMDEKFHIHGKPGYVSMKAGWLTV